MSEQATDLIKEWVVNDYFTPNIKAEVILDTLLTPYLPQILNDYGIDAVFLTKEMSLRGVQDDEGQESNSGDFRDHGIVGEKDRLWRTLEKFVPRDIDLLITEGTMLSRRSEAAANPVQTEEELGQRAEELFRRYKYNFVLVSSTNLDSIMEFYHHTPGGNAVCL